MVPLTTGSAKKQKKYLNDNNKSLYWRYLVLFLGCPRVLSRIRFLHSQLDNGSVGRMWLALVVEVVCEMDHSRSEALQIA